MGNIAPIRSHVVMDLLDIARGDLPADLRRLKAGQQLSRAYYNPADWFFVPIQGQFPLPSEDLLFWSWGIVQLAWSSHRLDIGFANGLSVGHVSLRVAAALGYANATGFAHNCANTARRAMVLAPYWKSDPVHCWHALMPDDCGFIADRIRTLRRGLPDHVYDVTGHSRLRGWTQARKQGAAA